MRRQAYVLTVCCLFLLPPQPFAQTPRPSAHAASAPGTPTASEILARLNQRDDLRRAALSRYESDRTYRLVYSGTGGQHQAELRVHVTYSAPGHKQLTVLSESGSHLLCDKVLRKLVASEEEAAEQGSSSSIALNQSNYIAQLLGHEDLPSPSGPEPAWILSVSPRDPGNKFAYRGQVWISQRDDAIIRIRGELPHSPSWWLGRSTFDARYTRHGGLWLPERNVSTSHVRLGGQATLTIDYGAYPVVIATPLKRAVQLASDTRP